MRPLRGSRNRYGGTQDGARAREQGRGRAPERDTPDRDTPDRDAADRGLATVWAATAVAVLIGVLVAMLDLASAVTARHRAEAAADLAALAAAGQAVRGSAVACARAGDAAGGTGARMVLCRLQGFDALVEVEVAVRLAMLGTVTVHGRARAGPAGA